MKLKTTIIVFCLIFIGIKQGNAQEFTFEDFVGTWIGTISSESFGGYNDPITMTIESDGFYTETTGHLMPTIYPNTQECEWEEETNRFHWWYLQTVYAGQHFYQHFFYELVYFQNDTLELHYNFWDDPEPHPQVGTIFLVKQQTVSLEEKQPEKNADRKLLRVFDINGRERSPKTKGEILIFQYSDGTVEKRIIR